MRDILVSEIFGPTIQGEGALVGRPTVFVRTGGCDFKCSWCDTLYAVLPEHKNDWTPMSAPAIFEEVARLSNEKPILVTLSGGNPAVQPLEPLLDLGHARGFTFALETQGTVAPSWFCKLDYLVLSPKPPSSDMETKWQKVAACIQAADGRAQLSLKIVVFDEVDYAFAREAAQHFPVLPVYLQPGNHTPDTGTGTTLDVAGITARLEWLMARARQDGWNNVTILPQLHTLLWGKKRGV